MTLIWPVVQKNRLAFFISDETFAREMWNFKLNVGRDLSLFRSTESLKNDVHAVLHEEFPSVDS